MRFKASTALFLLGLLTSPAAAADLAPAPLEAVPFNWTGFYLGVAAGGAFGQDDISIKDCYVFCSIKEDPNGVVAGGQLGAMYEVPTGGLTGVVVGAEVQGLWANLQDDREFLFGIVETEDKLGPLVTAKGQLGFAWDRALIYATGGWADARNEEKATIPIVGAKWSDDHFIDGFVAGAGAKFVVVDGTPTQSPSVIFGLEWNHFQLNGNHSSDFKFAGSPAKYEGCEYCYSPKLKTDNSFDFDVVTGNVSVKF